MEYLEALNEIKHFLIGALFGLGLHWIAWFNQWKHIKKFEERLKHQERKTRMLGTLHRDQSTMTPTDKQTQQEWKAIC